MWAHYLSAYAYALFVQVHIMLVHEAWDADSDQSTHQETSRPKQSWLWDALPREGGAAVAVYTLATLLSYGAVYTARRYIVSYSFFEQWNENEMEDVNFYIVAPHWYFRPHMGLLTVCAQHYEGLFWLASFYVLLSLMPQLHQWINRLRYVRPQADAQPLKYAPAQYLLALGFALSLLYVGSSLPCGRFYYEG
jgi:hypothetical protein